MDGEIGVQSQWGRGTRFWFTVRLAKQMHTMQNEFVPCEDLRGRRVCVVDRQGAQRRVIERYLTNWNMRCVMAEYEADAHTLLKQAADLGEPFDLAILSDQLAGIDWADFARTVTSHPILRATRLILLMSVGSVGMR
jgi:CheY-like chemotaxis protein